MAGEREASLAWVRSIVLRTVLKQSLVAGLLQRQLGYRWTVTRTSSRVVKATNKDDDVVTCTKGRGVAKMKD